MGTAAVLPGAGEDTACFLINGSVLFDTGWYAALKMQSYGYSPLDVEWLIFTHCHHDHYMGLPGLLFFRSMSVGWGRACAPLKIIGPPSDLEIVVRLSQEFLQAGRFPVVWQEPELFPLPPGETFETESFQLRTCRSLHGVAASGVAMCCRAAPSFRFAPASLPAFSPPRPDLSSTAISTCRVTSRTAMFSSAGH